MGSIPITRSINESRYKTKDKGTSDLAARGMYMPLSLFFCFVSAFLAHIAQSVEHFLGKEEVIGSIPIMGTI